MALRKENIYCVIMAGGIGSRFWPMSRISHPKQFLDILGTGKTLIQQTFDRFLHLCPRENILVVTNERYRDLVFEQLKGIGEDQVLCEPARRNTAPCIAYACYKIDSRNPSASVIIAPSDHLILHQEVFLNTAKIALRQASEKDCLVTLGIKPSRPDTGYGYIQFRENSNGIHDKVKKIKTFTEKPDSQLAQYFLETGEFYWNSGIFIWSLPSILKAFKKYLPEVDHLFHSGIGKYYTPDESAFISQIYPMCKNISIDYGIMEKAKNAYVVLSEFGWSDLGTWGSLYEKLHKDKHHNTVRGKKVMMYDCEGCIVNVPDDKRVVLQGMKDFIVVEADNTLLICRKEEEQRIKQFVQDIKVAKVKNKK